MRGSNLTSCCKNIVNVRRLSSSARDDETTMENFSLTVRLFAACANVEDPESWRSNIRRQARADKIRIQTGVTKEIVYAIARRDAERGWSNDEVRWFHLSSQAHETAIGLGHDWLLAMDGSEGATACSRCRAVGYLNADEGIIDGDHFEDRCG